MEKEYKEDCFAFKITDKDRKIYKCNALKELDCSDCRFYKNIEEYKKQIDLMINK